jgi:hypothetical protein
METMLLGIGIILMLAGWRFVWRPTTLDEARDRLFDLRESVRSEFVRRGISLDHPLYVALRDLLNGHLRHTESASFSTLIAFHVSVISQPEVREALQEHIEKRFGCSDPDLAKFAKQTREQASLVMVGYVIETSVLALALVAVGLAIVAARRAARAVARLISGGHDQIWPRVFSRAAILTGALLATLQPIHASRSEAQVVMEECALKAA